jgi:4-amino-4-deoxy-L-arabinose transferase-like glycosyltransferase
VSVFHARAPGRATAPARLAQTLGSTALLGVAAFVAATLVSIDAVLVDDSWFLQVATRVAGGEALYRDVSFGSTPLAVYVTAPFVAVFGSEIVWVRLLTNLSFALSAALVVYVAGAFGVGRRWGILLVAALVAWGTPGEGAPYQTLALLFMVGSLAATLKWLEATASWRWLGAAGALAGASFGAKYNVGLLALGALLASVAIGGAPSLRRLLIASGSFAGVAIVVMAPVAASGALDAFWDYAVTGKSTYAERARVSYLTELGDIGPAVLQLSSLHDVRLLYRQLTFVVPLLALAGLVAAWVVSRGAERRRLVVVGAFGVAAFATIFPRADLYHVRNAMPAFVAVGAVAAAVISRRASARVATVARSLVWAWVVPGAIVLVAGSLAHLADGTYGASRLPHFRGLVLPEDDQERDLAAARALARAAAGKPLLLLVPDAGFYYLLSGVDNPTPFDYPLATTFGHHGEQDVIDAIASGRIPAVCVDRAAEARAGLEPAALLAYVEAHLHGGRDLGPCTVYSRAPPVAA